MRKVPKSYAEYSEDVMSNFDGEIDEQVAKLLKKRNIFSRYPAWNFNGKVWFDKKSKEYCCETWRYHVHIETVCGSLEHIMETLSDKYGNA